MVSKKCGWEKSGRTKVWPDKNVVGRKCGWTKVWSFFKYRKSTDSSYIQIYYKIETQDDSILSTITSVQGFKNTLSKFRLHCLVGQIWMENIMVGQNNGRFPKNTTTFCLAKFPRWHYHGIYDKNSKDQIHLRSPCPSIRFNTSRSSELLHMVLSRA